MDKITINFQSVFDEENGDLHVFESVDHKMKELNTKINRSIYHLKDQALHDSLVKLGWTPPDSDKEFLAIELLRDVENQWTPKDAVEREIYNNIVEYLKSL